MKSIFSFLVIQIFIASCQSNKQTEFKFLEPNEKYTRSMIENNKMHKIVLGCVYQYVLEQTDGIIVASYSSNGESQSVNESWVIMLDTNTMEEVLNVSHRPTTPTI